MSGGLGRRAPKDFEHIYKYPLSSRAAVELAPTPAVIGVNWYSGLDHPERDSAGHYWVGRSGAANLGRLRGGHCVALKPRGVRDNTDWWRAYDQGAEGACVGFGCSRVMTLMNRRRYFARWLWDRAKETDQWPETNPGDDEGTSVRAGLSILRDRGHVRWTPSLAPLDDERSDATARANLTPTLADGIAAYRWVTSIDDLLEVLGYQDVPYVDLLNSWGLAFPHVVRVPLDVMERLWREDGEVGVVVDR